jgi:hypothetical protein
MKKIVSTTAKILWVALGLAITAWTVFWYYQIRIIGNLGGVLAGTILLASGLAMLMFFMLMTGIFIITKFVIKKRKKK